MVLFDNVFPGQRVEVRWDNGIYKGTVRYKGPVATKKGEWVGLELDHAVGDSSGMLKGRRYFQSRPNYGVFVRADRIRFKATVRCLYDKYHRVSNNSEIDDFLFDTAKPDIKNGPYDPVNVSQNDFSRVKSSLGDYGLKPGWDVPSSWQLKHSVGHTLPAATMLRSSNHRPFTHASAVPFSNLNRSLSFYGGYDLDDGFETRPTVPKCHMPHSALKHQVRQGWQNSHYVREMTVPTGRMRMVKSQWNDAT